MDKENLESGIWKRILEVWNLDIGIPDLSAKTVAAHFWVGKLELGNFGRRTWSLEFGRRALSLEFGD